MTQDHATPGSTQPARSPHAVPRQSVAKMAATWAAALLRNADAKFTGTPPAAEDLFVQLAYGARIAEEVTSGRWCVVADLLRIGAAGSWTQVAAAMDMTAPEARDRWHAWLAREVAEYQRTGRIGYTPAEAAELRALAEAVAW